MSLSAPVPIKQFAIAILASTSLEDPEFIPFLVAEHLPAISHIYTNGANDLVMRFAASHGIPVTIHPLTGGKSLPQSTSQILENVKFAYIIADESSKSAPQIIAACEKNGVKHKLVRFDPVDYWRLKCCKISELIQAIPKEDVLNNVWLKSISKIL